jgi:hypothetical protein
LFVLFLGACGPHGCPLTAHCDQTVASGKPWSCPHDENNFGGFDEPCNGDSCDPGFTCAVGTCVPCSIAGDACCGASEINGGTCNPGLTCAYDSVQDWYTCQGCGATIGGACCPGNTCGVGMCMNGTCQNTSSNKCMGPNSYWVWVVDPNCNVAKHGFPSGTPDDAAQCVAETLALQFPASQGFEIGPVGQGNPDLVAPPDHATCPTNCDMFGTSNLTVDFASFSTAQLHRCEQNKDSSCTWSDSACPGD